MDGAVSRSSSFTSTFSVESEMLIELTPGALMESLIDMRDTLSNSEQHQEAPKSLVDFYHQTTWKIALAAFRRYPEQIKSQMEAYRIRREAYAVASDELLHREYEADEAWGQVVQCLQNVDRDAWTEAVTKKDVDRSQYIQKTERNILEAINQESKAKYTKDIDMDAESETWKEGVAYLDKWIVTQTEEDGVYRFEKLIPFLRVFDKYWKAAEKRWDTLQGLIEEYHGGIQMITKRGTLLRADSDQTASSGYSDTSTEVGQADVSSEEEEYSSD